MVGIVLFLLDIWLARTNQKDEIKIIYLSMEWSLTPTHPPGTSKQKSTYLYHDHTMDSLINATLRTWNLHAIQSLVDSSTPSSVNPVAKPKHSLSPPPRKYHVHWSFQWHQQGIENQTWGTNTLRCNRTVVKIETRIKFFCSCKKKEDKYAETTEEPSQHWDDKSQPCLLAECNPTESIKATNDVLVQIREPDPFTLRLRKIKRWCRHNEDLRNQRRRNIETTHEPSLATLELDSEEDIEKEGNHWTNGQNCHTRQSKPQHLSYKRTNFREDGAAWPVEPLSTRRSKASNTSFERKQKPESRLDTKPQHIDSQQSTPQWGQSLLTSHMKNRGESPSPTLMWCHHKNSNQIYKQKMRSVEVQTLKADFFRHTTLDNSLKTT